MSPKKDMNTCRNGLPRLVMLLTHSSGKHIRNAHFCGKELERKQLSRILKEVENSTFFNISHRSFPLCLKSMEVCLITSSRQYSGTFIEMSSETVSGPKTSQNCN